MSNKCFASLIDTSSMGPTKPEPALFIKTSILPSIDNTFSTIFFESLNVVKSYFSNSIPSKPEYLFGFLDVPYTLKLLDDKSFAM